MKNFENARFQVEIYELLEKSFFDAPCIFQTFFDIKI